MNQRKIILYQTKTIPNFTDNGFYLLYHPIYIDAYYVKGLKGQIMPFQESRKS
jgi:hypothetical protein